MAEYWENTDVLRLMSPSARKIGLALIALWAFPAAAEAQEYCVTCTEPAAMYRCVIEGARPGGKQPLQMLCITAMAKEGRHATCSIKGGTVFDCKGPVKRVPWAAYNEPGTKGTNLEALKSQAAQPAASDPNRPPRTVEEMARRANQETTEKLEKANEGVKEQVQSLGQKVGDTTKKTWRCIASLFTRCTE